MTFGDGTMTAPFHTCWWWHSFHLMMVHCCCCCCIHLMMSDSIPGCCYYIVIVFGWYCWFVVLCWWWFDDDIQYIHSVLLMTFIQLLLLLMIWQFVIRRYGIWPHFLHSTIVLHSHSHHIPFHLFWCWWFDIPSVFRLFVVVDLRLLLLTLFHSVTFCYPFGTLHTIIVVGIRYSIHSHSDVVGSICYCWYSYCCSRYSHCIRGDVVWYDIVLHYLPVDRIPTVGIPAVIRCICHSIHCSVRRWYSIVRWTGGCSAVHCCSAVGGDDNSIYCWWWLRC